MQAIFFSPHIHCGSCAANIQRHFSSISGIEKIQINVPQRRIHITWQAEKISQTQILDILTTQGYAAYLWQPLKNHDSTTEQRIAIKRIFVAGLGMMQVMSYTIAIYLGAVQNMDFYWKHFFDLFSLLVTTPVLFYSGKPFFVSAWQATKTRKMNMDVPVALAIALAFLFSVYNTLAQEGTVYFDSVIMFIFFLSIGRFAEMRARYKTEAVTQAMALLLPETAFRVQNENIEEIPLHAIQPKDCLLIKPGASIPADGIILSGFSQVNESLLTGESLPQNKKPGDSLIAGSINGSDMLHMEVNHIGDQLFLSSLLRLLEKAQSQKPKMTQLADRVAGHFILSILIISCIVAGAWLFIDPSRAFNAVLAVLIVTCPCALSLATPTVIVTASGSLARSGILMTNPDALLKLNLVNHLLLDKTGTLTQGRFALVETYPLQNFTKQKCLALAAALEVHSEHPLAKAFNPYLTSSVTATHCNSVPSIGLNGTIEEKNYWIGQPQAIAQQLGCTLPEFPVGQSDTPTWLVLADSQHLLAWFELEDPLRIDTKKVIEQCHKKHITCEIVSGDLISTVGAIAHSLQLHVFHGQTTPQAKHALIQQKQAEGKVVLMIGDGVNDAPILAQADVGIAMGQGTRIAQASADLIIMGDSLSPVLAAFQIAKKTQAIIVQNIFWAIGYNIIAIPLAAMDLVPAWVAAIGMSASSLVVVLNALRLRPPA